MTNDSNFKCGLTCDSNPDTVNESDIYLRNSAKANFGAKSFLWLPECEMTNDSNFKCGLTRDSNPDTVNEKRHGDTRILELGEELIAEQAQYHSSCRRNYIRQKHKPTEHKSNRKKHEEAFQKLCVFLEHEVIENKTPLLATTIFKLYSEEYFAVGGTQSDLEQYSVQMLMYKVQERLTGISIDKQSNKSGSFVFSSSMTREDALVKLSQGNNTKENLIRLAAMALRTEILAMTPTKPPSPTSVYNLKETAPAIPHLVSLFYSTLIGGLQADSLWSSDANKRRVLASASDALFNCSKGRVRPWKHQALGLGIGTLTGSKSVLNILNRFGHCVSYDEVKRLETEIAYTCSEENRESPDGLSLNSNLGTACAWDNFDVNTETLDGKSTLHCTVGICYQNAVPKRSYHIHQ
ncbi:uncharacterized protein LOC123509921 [Portunus trituberculatus]|uniref:uncharacterized protein LOC123509921 n=1 Tax=Portunus trituberculatus TaxID=210409 RepID=UPI001E1D1A34|nr:uncharacterized protein LOC123509921 [Portunus trituberculatus]